MGFRARWRMEREEGEEEEGMGRGFVIGYRLSVIGYQLSVAAGRRERE
jgi:hypothetical protein